MADPVDKEIAAIKTVLGALEPLSTDVRNGVLEYVLKRLNIQLHSAVSIQGSAAVTSSPSSAPSVSGEQVHIEVLKDAKKPRSVNEMAALVAYYLAEIAPPSERKATVSVDDIKRYFKIGRYPLPHQPRNTLLNAKNSGYFDSVGNGEFRLNPVGYNLVAYAMPRGSAAATARKKSKRKSVRKGRK
jgi:hypothetical protein